MSTSINLMNYHAIFLQINGGCLFIIIRYCSGELVSMSGMDMPYG